MIFTDEQINALRSRIEKLLSPSRFRHTVGVAKMAELLANAVKLKDVDEIVASAWLHDVSKELPTEKHLELMKQSGNEFTYDDYQTVPAYHSFTAPEIVKSDFSEFATKNVLSAVFRHTLGAPNMSISDAIVFLSDYIEEGRTYTSCAELRTALLDALDSANTVNEKELLIFRATLTVLDNTLMHLIKSAKHINQTTVLTRNSLVENGVKPL